MFAIAVYSSCHVFQCHGEERSLRNLLEDRDDAVTAALTFVCPNASRLVSRRSVGVKPPGGDWTAVIVLAIVGAVALTGVGFLGGYAVGYAQARPVAQSSSPTAESTATPSVDASPTAAASDPNTHPTATTKPTPTPSPTPTPVECWFGDFPYYPGSLAVAASTQGAEAYHSYASATTVANYFTNGGQPTGLAVSAGLGLWRAMDLPHEPGTGLSRLTRGHG